MGNKLHFTFLHTCKNDNEINFEGYDVRDYSRLLLDKKHQSAHTDPERWDRDITVDREDWTNAFKTTLKACKENKLRELQFKFIHRIVVQRKNFLDLG